MITFIKAQLNSIVSTLVDFIVTVLLVEVFGVWYITATVTGAIAGGITNFTLGRNWVFMNREGALNTQIARYLLVWCGSILLNTSGVFLLTDIFYAPYIVSKAIVTILVGVLYNFVLQKKYVFR